MSKSKNENGKRQVKSKMSYSGQRLVKNIKKQVSEKSERWLNFCIKKQKKIIFKRKEREKAAFKEK